MTRRPRIFAGIIFLTLSLVLSCFIFIPHRTGAQETPPSKSTAESRGPAWRIGIQAWTFKNFSLFEAIEKAKSVGIKYLEAYPGQLVTPERPNIHFHHKAPTPVLAQVKIHLEKAGVSLVNYGVVPLGKDEAANRLVFDFAKLMGIETIVSEPEPGSFELVDRLCQEYGINVAVHNHPKYHEKHFPFKSIYWDPDAVLEAIKGCSSRVGVCADTGHWMRSGVDPLQALKKLEGRILSFHLKDLNVKEVLGHDVPWGTGQGNVKALLEEMARQKFTGVFSIEYEHNWNSSLPDIAKCVSYFNQVSLDLLKK